MRRILFWIVPVIIWSCSQPARDGVENAPKEESRLVEIPDSILLKEVSKLTAGLQTALASELTKAIADSGIGYALSYCNAQALPLTKAYSREHGIQIARISHKPRNPANQADSGELIIIKQFIEQNSTTGADINPVIIRSEDSLTVYSPIKLFAPLCLQCHGEPGKDIAPENYILIQMLYPEDRATGFKLGDIRGSWRVTFPVQYFEKQNSRVL